MNSASLWLRLVALCPLATIGLDWLDALLLGGVLALTLLVVDAGLLALRKWSTSHQQITIAVLLAAIATGCCDLLLQAFCPSHAQALQPFLPLPIVAAVLFCNIASLEATPSKWTGMLRGAAFMLALLLGAILHAALPAEAGIAAGLIASGLLLAIGKWLQPERTSSEASTSAPRTRARVTGPLR